MAIELINAASSASVDGPALTKGNEALRVLPLSVARLATVFERKRDLRRMSVGMGGTLGGGSGAGKFAMRSTLNALCGWWVFRRALRDLDPRAALAAG